MLLRPEDMSLAEEQFAVLDQVRFLYTMPSRIKLKKFT